MAWAVFEFVISTYLMESKVSQAVVSATAESLTTENWDLIIDLCDTVNNGNAETARDAVAALRQRLATDNQYVQLYSLTLLNSLAQNCGDNLQNQVTSSETCNALLALNRSGAPAAVKDRLFEVVKSMSEALNKPPLRDVYEKLLESKRPRNQPQAAPAPVQENKQSRGPTRVRAIYDLDGDEGELSFRKGDVIQVLDRTYDQWWQGACGGRQGLFPINYVQDLEENTDVSSVNYVLDQAGNVERLLGIFAMASKHPEYSVVKNKEVQALYREIVGLRPRVLQLLDEYSDKRRRLVLLNQQLGEARRTYDELAAARIASPSTQPNPQSHYTTANPQSNYTTANPQSNYTTPYPPSAEHLPRTYNQAHPLPNQYTGTNSPLSYSHLNSPRGPSQPSYANSPRHSQAPVPSFPPDYKLE